MALGDFEPVVGRGPVLSTRNIHSHTFLVKDMFSLPTLFLIGAGLQTLLLAVLPQYVALLPAGAWFCYTVSATIIKIVKGKDSYLYDIIPGRVSAQLPDYSGSFGRKPASRPLVVFHLGVRFHHPLGVVASGGLEAGRCFETCVADLTKHASNYGLLGHSFWRADERASRNSLLAVFYFEAMEGLTAYAQSEHHKAAWKWYQNFCKDIGCHIGVYHETFLAAPGSYETIYINMQPVLLGQTKVKTKGLMGGDEFIQPLVDADIEPLKSQLSRMGLSKD